MPAAPARATLLTVGVAAEDFAEIARLPEADRFRFLAVGGEDEAVEPERCRPRALIAEARRLARAHPGGVAGVIGTEDYPPSLLVPAIAAALNLPAPSLAAVLRCEHKGWSRILQRRLVPEATPPFFLVDPGRPGRLDTLPYPLWVKPVKAYMSMFGRRVAGPADMAAHLADLARVLPPFARPFDELLALAPPLSDHADVTGAWAVAERVMAGRQCTLEGYVFQGEVTVLGIVDSIRFPNRVSFKHFLYPSALPSAAQGAMAQVARRLMPALGFRHGQFNIEFFWDPARRRAAIIEVNSRFSPQFADLFEKVDGFSTYGVLLDLALGRRPRHGFRQGRHRMAGSFVLRRFTDALVTRVPGPADLGRALAHEPDARVKLRAKAGERLSQWPQDSYSFRYGLIHVGGDDLPAMRAKVRRIARALDFGFAPAGLEPAHRDR